MKNFKEYIMKYSEQMTRYFVVAYTLMPAAESWKQVDAVVQDSLGYQLGLRPKYQQVIIFSLSLTSNNLAYDHTVCSLKDVCDPLPSLLSLLLLHHVPLLPLHSFM